MLGHLNNNIHVEKWYGEELAENIHLAVYIMYITSNVVVA